MGISLLIAVAVLGAIVLAAVLLFTMNAGESDRQKALRRQDLPADPAPEPRTPRHPAMSHTQPAILDEESKPAPPPAP